MNPQEAKTHAMLKAISPLYWAGPDGIKLMLNGERFDISNHRFLIEPLNSYERNRVHKFSAQTSKTLEEIITVLHQLIYGYLPQGAMYVFPTTKTVRRFSQARFSPLIKDNPEISKYIPDTDNIELKRVGKANLYFAGGKVGQVIEGLKKSSTQLKSEPVDKLIFDERDEIEDEMIDLAESRLYHSKLKHKATIGTPTIPDFGIDAAYQESDQRVWMIKCQHCNTDTCLEMEFPQCIHVISKKKAIRACIKCGKEIFPRNGRWVAQYPERSEDCVGRWISQLNLSDEYVNVKDVLDAYNDPPHGNLAEVMNSMLGIAYIKAENRLRPIDLQAIMTHDPMRTAHPGPTAMGVDVGKGLHVVILDKPMEKSIRLVKAIRLTSFEDLHDLARDFNVRCAVIDMLPETRKVMEFREAESFEVYGWQHEQGLKGIINWDSILGTIRGNRTFVLDGTHDLVVLPGRFSIPRKSTEIDEFIKQCCNMAKIVFTDDETGIREYRYRRLGADHFRHSLGYAFLAAGRIGVYNTQEQKKRLRDSYAEEDTAPTGSWRGNL
jgi:hypothetical protein